ncbi:MAG: hypothetical protein HYX36_11350 [Rhizobiales bacterium]|nr:hypothetical protein [Hyphomicrobiales bacterium]
MALFNPRIMKEALATTGPIPAQHLSLLKNWAEKVRGGVPILLDLTGAGIQVAEYSRSQKFVDSEGDGKGHRSAWAGTGTAVLFVDSDGSNSINEKKEYIFTEWDRTAVGDIEAIRSVFDSNHDGKLSSADTNWSQFKVELTNADGSTTVQTLAQAGIAAIDLTADATSITLPDGRDATGGARQIVPVARFERRARDATRSAGQVITGQTTFTKTGGGTGTVANTMLMADGAGYAVTQTVTTDASNNRVVKTGDKVWDHSQTIATATVSGVKTETLKNYQGDAAALGRCCEYNSQLHSSTQSMKDPLLC